MTVPVGLQTPTTDTSPFARFVDSALIIAGVLAALHFAGWTYRQTYLRPFSIDPNSIDGSSIAIAVEGLTAIMTTFASLLKAILFLIVATVGTYTAIYIGDRWRRRRNSDALFDRASIVVAKAGSIALMLMLGIGSGKVAGDQAVQHRIEAVRRCNVWYYQIGSTIVPGVMLVQSSSMSWILTQTGVRPVKTEDISFVSGPVFSRVIGAKDRTPAPLCTPIPVHA